MSEEDLEVLITLDDPEDPEKEDTFHNLQADNTQRSLVKGDRSKRASSSLVILAKAACHFPFLSPKH
jgi:hypothetical protein